jgi:hypothetical protein
LQGGVEIVHLSTHPALSDLGRVHDQPPVLLLYQQDPLNQGETSGDSRENPLGYRP